MADHTTEHTAPTARKRLVAAVLAGVCVLALACIPAAVAKPDHVKERPGSSTSSASAPSTSTTGGSSEASNASGSSTSSPAEHHTKAETKKAETKKAETKKVEAKKTEAKKEAKKDRAGVQPAASSDTAGEPDASASTPEAAVKKASGGGEPKTKPKTKPKAKPPHGKAGKTPAPKEAAPPEVAHPSETSVAAPLASTAEPIASVAAVSPVAAPPTAGASPPAVAATSPQAKRRVGRSRARAKARRGDSGAVAAPAGRLDPVPAVLAAPARAVTPARRLRVAPTRPARARPSQLVRTITRIVNVVPTPVRILIGALLALALALAVRSRLSTVRARRLERQRGQLLEDVGLLQAALLPVPPARLGPVGTSVAYRPADGPGAGGDFYDVFALEDGQLGVIVGDVSGHGRQALPHTALVRFTLRAYLEAGLSPRAAVQTAGAVLEHQLGGSFATVVVATYEPRKRVLAYACAGHPAPVVLGSRDDAKPIVPVTVCSAPPIGVGMRTGIRQTVVSVPGASQVCFYTDGVTEARVGPELFGPERLAHVLAELGPHTSAVDLLDRVSEEADRRPDDMAACLLSVAGGSTAPAVLVEELELGREDAASERTEQFLLACGLARNEIEELAHTVRAAAGRNGTVVLEAHLNAATPRVVLQHDNVAFLHTRLDGPRADLMVSR